MSETTSYCGAMSCGRPAPAGTLCETCYDELVEVTSRLTWALEELENAATNQVRFTTGGGSRSTEIPLMFNPKASAELASLTATVMLWQSRVADHLGMPVRYIDAHKAADWIHRNLDRTRTYIDAGKMLDSFTYARDSIERTLNRPPARQFLGDCETKNDGHTCPGRMFSFAEEPEARCDTCGHTVPAADLRLSLLRKLDSRLLTASEIARMATYMGLTINREQVRKRINQWHNRDRIQKAAGDDENPQFRFLEVRLLLEQDEETRQSA